MESIQNYSHILTIDIDKELCDDDKNEVESIIYDTINNKVIIKNVLNMNVPIKWIVSNSNDLLTYHTDVKGMLGDTAVHEHTQILLNDIKKTMDIHKFNFIVSKPLTKQICLFSQTSLGRLSNWEPA